MAKTESIKQQSKIAQQNTYNAMPLNFDPSQIIIDFTRSAKGKSSKNPELYNLSVKEKIINSIKKLLEEKYNELQKQLDEVKNAQSGNKFFNWIKNTIGLNPDLNSIKKQLNNIKKQLKELENDSADISKIYKNFTGKDLNNDEIKALLKTEAPQTDDNFQPINADYTAEDLELDRKVTNGRFKKMLLANSSIENDPLGINALKKELDASFDNKHQAEKDSLLKNLNENNIGIIKEIIARQKQKDGSLDIDINQLNELSQSITSENKDILLQMIKMKDSEGKNIFSTESLKTIAGKIKPENVEVLTKMIEMKNSDGKYIFDSNSLIKTADKIKPENIEILTRMMGMKNSKGTCVFSASNFCNVAGTSQTEEIIKILKCNKISTDDKVTLLKSVRDNSVLSENYLSDARKIMNGEPIIKGFKEGSSLEAVIKKVPIGEVVTIGKKLYVNDNGSLVELNMTKEKYLELFPPIKRFSLNQKQLGDCWLVSTLDDLMNDPAYRAKLYKLFRQDGDDIYIKFPDGKNEIKFPGGKVILSKNGKNVNSASGFQMIEQAFTIHRKNEYTNNQFEDITAFSGDIDKQMEKLKKGSRKEALLGLLGKDNVKVVKNTSRQGNFRKIIEEYANKLGTLVSFGTIDKKTPSGTQTEHELNGNYNVYSNHAYEIAGYDKENDIVFIKNPWGTGFTIRIPLLELMNHIKNILVTEAPLNNVA